MTSRDSQGDHYYSQRPKAAHRRREIQLDVHGIRLSLVSDAGVFSRDAIDPGTKLLLASVQPPVGGLILDVGCGYGPIGLYYAARCKECTVHLSDVNKRAVDLADENARRNGLLNTVIHWGSGLETVAGLSFDLIVTNPPIRAGRKVVLEIFKSAHDRLVSGGRFAFVARTQQGAKTLARELDRTFGNVEDVARAGGYRVYEAVRSSPR